MDKEKYFGQYKKNNTKYLTKLIKQLNKEVSKYQLPEGPFFKGNFNFNYYNYLSQKHLNYDSLNVDLVFRELSHLFQNLPNWGNPGTMLNVIPPVNLPSLAASSYAQMYNPNFSQDSYAGLLLATELEVVKYISELIGWNWECSHGIFTFGGKATNLYGTKCALNKAYYRGKKYGYGNKDLFLITSTKGHPCHAEVSDWLGIGSDNCISIKCDRKGRIIVEEAENVICDFIKNGKILVGFNLTGGSTVEFEVDQIKDIYNLRNKLVEQFKLKYKPHIHVDSVLAWIWLFFKEYDFDKNPLKIPSDVQLKIHSMTKKISELKYADSIGIDFHKTGYTPNISSLFLVKDRNDMYKLGDNKRTLPIRELRFGNFSPFETSLELSRSCHGAVSALVSLKTLGIRGYQQILVQLLSTSEYFRNQLGKINFIEILNDYSEGFASLFIIKPMKYENLSLKEILELSPDDTNAIKDYNLNYALYVSEKNVNNEIPFTLTASDAFNVINTNVCLGTQKAYPMSIFTTVKDINNIIKAIIRVKKEFDSKQNKNFEKVKDSPVDMVYRKK